MSYTFDVALSFATEDQPLAETVYQYLTVKKISVFFAPSPEGQVFLTGKNQRQALFNIFGMNAQFVALFVSKYYVAREVPMEEARIALACHAQTDKIIPIYMDGTPLPSDLFDPKNMNYFKSNNPAMIAVHIAEKINKHGAIDNPAVLKNENQKQITNESDGNSTCDTTQIFCQNIEEIKYNHPSKSYNLCDTDQCTEFVEMYKNSEYLVTAIILSIFEFVALSDLSDLQNNLIPYLPLPKTKDGKDTEKYYSQQDSYLSLSKILGTIGGKKFITEDGQTCARLGEDSDQALVNILEEFPSLYEPIASWLIHMNEIYEYKTSLKVDQIVAAFSRIISFDIINAKSRIFLQLYPNPQNVVLLGNLAYNLYKNDTLRKEVETIILQWINSDSVWLWRAACLSYYLFKENDISFSFEQHLYQAISKRIVHFEKDDWSFISVLLIRSKHIRTMISSIFCSMYQKAESTEKKIILANAYLKLIKYCSYMIKTNYMELPLVVYDTRQQQHHINPIVAHIMSAYGLRKQLFTILETYLKKLTDIGFSDKLINLISAYFYYIASNDTSYKEIILDFLKNCKNNAAALIYKRLKNEYTKTRYSKANEFNNKLIVKEEAYQNGLYPRVPRIGKTDSAFILTGGCNDDIIVCEYTTPKDIRKGKYNRLVEISTLPYLQEIRFQSPSKETHYFFDVCVKVFIKVNDPIVYYKNRNLDFDTYFNALFSLDVKKITGHYSILNYSGMDDELTQKLSSYNTIDESTGFRYQISVVDATPEEHVQEYVQKYRQQHLDAELKKDARKLSSSFSRNYEDAIMTEVAEGKISKSEAIIKIKEYNLKNFEDQVDRINKLQEDGLITDTEARTFVKSALDAVSRPYIKPVLKECKTERPIMPLYSNLGQQEAQILNIDQFYSEEVDT